MITVIIVNHWTIENALRAGYDCPDDSTREPLEKVCYVEWKSSGFVAVIIICWYWCGEDHVIQTVFFNFHNAWCVVLLEIFSRGKGVNSSSNTVLPTVYKVHLYWMFIDFASDVFCICSIADYVPITMSKSCASIVLFWKSFMWLF